MPLSSRQYVYQSGASNRIALAWQDLVSAVRRWRLWAALGNNDIAQRYRRSSIGQFWITISMAVFVATIGSVYALLFRAEIQHHLPHVVVYYIVWSFISTAVNEGAGAFIDAERYLRQEMLPKLAFVLRVMWRNTLAFLHNLVLVPVTLLAFGSPISAGAFYALAGFAVLIANLSLVVVLVAVLCTRFRDLRQILQNGMQMLFFVSPIMWQPGQLPPAARALVDFNPAAMHLRIVCDPLLGEQLGFRDFVAPLLCTVLLVALVTPIFIRFRERLVYWL